MTDESQEVVPGSHRGVPPRTLNQKPLVGFLAFESKQASKRTHSFVALFFHLVVGKETFVLNCGILLSSLMPDAPALDTGRTLTIQGLICLHPRPGKDLVGKPSSLCNH